MKKDDCQVKSVSLKQKIDSALSKTPRILKDFFYSDIYLAILAMVIFLSWYFNLFIVGLITISLISTVAFVILNDVTPLVAVLFFIPFALSNNTDVSAYYPLIALLIPLFLAMGFHVVYYRPQRFVFGKLFAPQVMVTLALLVGGCTSITADRYLGALPYSLLLGLGVLVIYSFATNYVRMPEGLSLSKYVAKIFMWAGIILCFQMLVFYVRLNAPMSEWGKSGWIDLGWGIDNNVATILLLTAPMCCYLSTKCKHPFLYMLIGIVQYGVIVITYSRGGLLFAAVSTPLTAVFTIIKSRNRKESIIVVVVALAVLGTLIGVFFNKIQVLISGIFQDGLSSTSRVALYKEAWQVFTKHPVFGGGTGYPGVNYEFFVLTFYWFHSTFFQVIGSMGLVGLVAYGFLYFRRFATVFTDLKKNTFFLFAFASILGFELYSMIDTGTFVPLPSMMIVMVLQVFLEKIHTDLVKDQNKIELREQNVLMHSGIIVDVEPLLPSSRKAYFALKMIADKLCALIGLIILTPMLLIVALIIAIDSRGPIVFLQERVGKNQKVFKILKFRTMRRVDIPFDINNPVIRDDDANLTRAGKWIRKLKLDEFLQLINVLKGDMSLIGPRPLKPEYLSHYQEWELHKFDQKPGMSGLAQVCGNGYLSSPERSYYDVLYTRTCNASIDLQILLKTVGVLIVGEKRFLHTVDENDMKMLVEVLQAPEIRDTDVSDQDEQPTAAE